MKTVVVGVDSRIGQALSEALRERGDLVFGTSRRPGAAAKGYAYLDLAAPDFERFSVPSGDVAFFCAAMSRFADCRAAPALARRVNVSGPAALARDFVARGTRVVLLSTSAVYDGRRPLVRPSRPPCPVTDYGRLKAEAEAEFLSLGTAAAILRLTKVLEPSQPLFQSWVEALTSGNTIRAFADMRLAPITLDEAVEAALVVAADAQGGIYQASAASDISYLDAACHLAARVGVSRARVIAQRGAEHGIPPEQLVPFSSLDSSRLAALTGRAAPEPLAVIDRVYGPIIDRARARER